MRPTYSDKSRMRMCTLLWCESLKSSQDLCAGAPRYKTAGQSVQTSSITATELAENSNKSQYYENQIKFWGLLSI